MSDRLSERLARLSPEQRALLAKRMLRKQDPPPARAIPRRSGDRPVPASFGQERLWFLEQLEPGNPAYHLTAAVWVDGPLDADALRHSLRALVLRHEVLRTTFRTIDGQPFQVVAPEPGFELRIEDQPVGGGAEDRERRARRIVSEETRRPYDLERGPMLRARLVAFGERRHLLVLGLHHIATDGWSQGILMRELSALYRACQADPEAPPLPELEIQYSDFALWQRRRLSGEVLERQLAYWREQLRALPALELPADHPRPAVPSGVGRVEQLRLPGALVGPLTAADEATGTTPFMAFLAAFAGLLSRLSGQRDFAVGSPIANRRRTELEGLIGLFINMLAMRVGVHGDPSYRRLLARVRETSLAAYSYQDLPFEKVVDELAPERHMGRSPLFQVLFAVQNMERRSLRFAGAETRPVAGDVATTRFDLELYAWESDEDWRLAFIYNADLFEPPTIRRMARHFRNLVRGAAAAPERRVSELPMLGQAEQLQLLVEWNETRRRYPFVRPLHDLVEEQAARTPDAVAVEIGEAAVTYAELDRRANRLARFLAGLGAGPDVPVGVCLERSVEMVVALLGVLKAGGAYVPLDPDYPAARLAMMLEEARAPIVLTQRRLWAALAKPAPASQGGAEPGRAIVCLAEAWSEVARQADDSPAVEVAADHLAYVIYTSGSTGRPKGVMSSHGAIVNRLRWMQEAYRLGAGDRVLQKTPYSFDVSVWEFFWPLIIGARLVVARPGGHRDPEYLVRTINRRRISTLHFVPSMLRAFLQARELHTISGLERVICSGEALPPELRDAFVLRVKAELHNLYGPTEAAVDVTACRCDDAARGTPVPIGRPIANTTTHVFDPAMRPVPIGVAGQLLLGGVQLARGYLGRPALTADRFVPDPYGRGGRLYLTGDLVRRDAEGQLIYLGRLDHQIKLRGFRIELGEIEATLEALPAVEQAVVLLHEEQDDRRLVAFLLGAGQDMPPETEIRARLTSELPDYMIPAAFVAVAELPLTASGKVDRKVLGGIASEHRAAAGTAEAAGRELPRGPVEEAVAAAFAEVLNRPHVGLHTSFFRLGGHSLLATQLLSRLRSALDTELPLRALFEAPTVADLAARFEAARQAGQGLELPPITAGSRGRHLPLSYAQDRLWFLDRMDPGDPTLNLPSGVRLRGSLSPPALEAGLTEVVRRHQALRTRFLEVDGRPVQEVLPAAPMLLPVIDLGALPVAQRLREVKRWQAREVSEPFDLARGPLIRAQLLRLADDDHALLLNLHHIAGDGWSLGLLWEELAALYRAASTGIPSRLSELTVQYGDYAIWQRRWLGGDELKRQTDYWRRRLEGPPAALELPADRPRPVTQSHRGRSTSRRLDAQLAAQLRELGWQQHATLFMVLLAAFKVLLSRWSGQHDVVVGTPIAGRTRSEIEGLIGLFLNSLVLRTDLAGDPTFVEVLQRVREATLGAYSHQDVPFEKLLAELQPERDPSRTPLFQVFFNMLELPSTAGQQFEGLDTEALPLGAPRSKFDLTIYVNRQAAGIGIYLVYNTDLFDREPMDELLAQYQALLVQIAARPERRVDRLSLVTEHARRVLPPLRESSLAPAAAQAAAPAAGGWRAAHDVFTRLAAAEPGRPAVIDPQGTLSYGELAAQTDALAVEFAAAGVSRGDLVAIYGHRSAALVWAVLGVHRSGGAFLILDPAHPPARQVEILKHAAPAAWIELAGHPPPESLGVAVKEIFGARRLTLPARSEWPAWRRPAAPPEIELAAADLAYVAFTSGSTGGPKGICGRHGSLSHFLPWQIEAFGFGPEDRFSMLSGLAHDPLQRDIFTPLQVGAAVVIPDPEEMFQPGALASWMATEGITVAHLTPALGQVLAETGGRAVELPALRWAFLVGDVLTRRLVAKLESLSPASLREDLAPALCCVNYYGSTETQRAVAYHPVAAGESRRRRAPEVLPLGRGIPDVQLLVLGRSGSLAGIGEVGEIAVASPHVALGYLQDPALTAMRFTPDPRGEAGRVYRTGDLGRYRPDGEVVFLRRADHQIKLRGYRIEPAEIEAVLGCHPAVGEVAVGLMDDAAGEEILVAWWTAPRGAKAKSAELRELAAKHLPVVMVPAVYVPLDDLPLTPTGKLDRAELRRLAVPALAAQRQERRRSAPRDAFQVQLVSLWEQVLRRNPIGVTENFFDLGGHSLLAIRLFALIEQTFDQALPISTLFQAPTVEQLARVLRRQGYRSRWSSVVPIHPWGDRPPLFCVHGITGDPFIYRNLAQHLGSDQPLYGLLARGLDGQAPPFTRIPEMAAYYLREIRQVQPRGPYYLGGFCFGGVAASEIARQLIAAGERIALVASFDGHAAISRTLPRQVFRRYQRRQLRWRFEQQLEIARTLPPRKRIVYLCGRGLRLAAAIAAGWRKRWFSFSSNDRSPPPTDVAAANRVASRAYAPDFYPGRVAVFRSAESLGEIFLDPELGWQVLAEGGIELHEIPGLHHAMFDEPNVEVLAAKLRRCLDAAFEAEGKKRNNGDTTSDQD